jgi:hypothetical protein
MQLLQYLNRSVFSNSVSAADTSTVWCGAAPVSYASLQEGAYTLLMRLAGCSCC